MREIGVAAVMAAGVLALGGGCKPKLEPGDTGLKSLAGALVDDAKDGVSPDLTKLINGLQLTDAERADVYNDDTGKLPSQAYGQAWTAFAQAEPAAIAAAVKAGATEIDVVDLSQVAAGADAEARAAKAKMAEVKPGVSLYHVSLRQPLQALGIPVGDFAFVDNAWRYVLVGPIASTSQPTK
jgi:hypothetical protein